MQYASPVECAELLTHSGAPNGMCRAWRAHARGAKPTISRWPAPCHSRRTAKCVFKVIHCFQGSYGARSWTGGGASWKARPRCCYPRTRRGPPRRRSRRAAGWTCTWMRLWWGAWRRWRCSATPRCSCCCWARCSCCCARTGAPTTSRCSTCPRCGAVVGRRVLRMSGACGLLQLLLASPRAYGDVAMAYIVQQPAIPGVVVLENKSIVCA